MITGADAATGATVITGAAIRATGTEATATAGGASTAGVEFSRATGGISGLTASERTASGVAPLASIGAVVEGVMCESCRRGASTAAAGARLPPRTEVPLIAMSEAELPPAVAEAELPPAVAEAELPPAVADAELPPTAAEAELPPAAVDDGEAMRTPRPERCAGAAVVGESVESESAAGDEREADESGSANAAGITAKPEPTPNATASAPTRPT